VASGLLDHFASTGKGEHDMQTVVGVVRHHSETERLVESLRDIEIASRSISVLSPSASSGALRNVPTAESEQPGIGAMLGSVVGGAAGTAGGLAATAVMLPGAGAVIATGAITLGVVGALAGSAAGHRLDEKFSNGLPMDELYVYRDALQKGRSIVIVTAEDEAQATQVRDMFADLGAESVDAAREQWWIGLRDAEEAEYTRQGGDFRADETPYRLGFDAAARLHDSVPPYDEARAVLRERYGPIAEERAFRVGYERCRARRAMDGL
jgi:outer membrane lipoprotein SlyB